MKREKKIIKEKRWYLVCKEREKKKESKRYDYGKKREKKRKLINKLIQSYSNHIYIYTTTIAPLYICTIINKIDAGAFHVILCKFCYFLYFSKTNAIALRVSLWSCSDKKNHTDCTFLTFFFSNKKEISK